MWHEGVRWVRLETLEFGLLVLVENYFDKVKKYSEYNPRLKPRLQNKLYKDHLEEFNFKLTLTLSLQNFEGKTIWM